MRFIALSLTTALFLGACASGNWPQRADPSLLSNTPERFLVLNRATGSLSEIKGTACSNPLADPRDGTTLRLIRSISGLGDYQPDTLRYGLKLGQFILIDCTSGKSIGVVPE